MDLGTVIGLVFVNIIVIIVGMKPSNIGYFIDMQSIYIVFGGLSGILFVCFPASTVLSLIRILKNAFMPPKLDFVNIIKQIIEFSEQARREGILSLESKVPSIQDEFLKKGIQLAVDGTEPELIKDIMSAEVTNMETRHNTAIAVVGTVAEMGPAFGMIGTLVGLVLMLVNMADPSSIGPAMAVAIITTFYGSFIANVFMIPLSYKLKTYNAMEVLLKNIMLEGVMSLQSGDNPRIVEQKLTAFVEPAMRQKILLKDKK